MEHMTGWVCIDCIMLIANGETPPEMSEDETEKWLAKMDDDTEVTLGIMAEDHVDDCPNIEDGEWIGESDCYCETIEFSMNRCDNCDTHLAGSRHGVTLWWHNGEETA